MMCPKCYGPTTVLETREKADGSIRRRRRCLDCGHKFTTLETVQEDKHGS